MSRTRMRATPVVWVGAGDRAVGLLRRYGGPVPPEGFRRIDAHLRGEAVSSARIDRGAADVMQHDESAIRLEPSCDGPFHIAVVEYVDVFVHDDDPLHRRVGPEGGHDRVLPVSL